MWKGGFSRGYEICFVKIVIPFKTWTNLAWARDQFVNSGKSWERERSTEGFVEGSRKGRREVGLGLPYQEAATRGVNLLLPNRPEADRSPSTAGSVPCLPGQVPHRVEERDLSSPLQAPPWPDQSEGQDPGAPGQLSASGEGRPVLPCALLAGLRPRWVPTGLEVTLTQGNNDVWGGLSGSWEDVASP